MKRVPKHILYLFYGMIGHTAGAEKSAMTGLLKERVLERDCTVNADGSFTCEDCGETRCTYHICPPGAEGEMDCDCEVYLEGIKCKDCYYCDFGNWETADDCTNADGLKWICDSTFSNPTDSMPPDLDDEKQVDTCIHYENYAWSCYFCRDNVCRLHYCPPSYEDQADCSCELDLYGIKCRDCNYCGDGEWTFGGDCSNIPQGKKKECESEDQDPYSSVLPADSMPPDADDKKELDECVSYPDGSSLCYFCLEGNICELRYCPPDAVADSDCFCELELYGIKCNDCYYCGDGEFMMGGDCSNLPVGQKWVCD